VRIFEPLERLYKWREKPQYLKRINRYYRRLIEIPSFRDNFRQHFLWKEAKMPTVRSRKGTLRIDTVPLPERKAKGSIQKIAGKYILAVEGRELDIPVGPILPEADIEQFVGKEVAVFFSKVRPQDIVAIGTWPTPEKPRFRCVLCYYPGPDVIRRINPKVREVLIGEMVKSKIISPALGRYLKAK
jgi:hypothetical protein